MSDDICERLVRFSKHKQCMSTDLEVEAADEITRLREENARLREETDGGKADDCKSCGCQYESWKANYQRLTIQNDALREENARLRDIVLKYLEGSMREKDIRAAAAAIREGGKKDE